ncbi:MULTISPECIES: hypothetical protein [unclassified Pseudoalteromonas]|uniref:hypothetical protein n=1 Tax=unclassified Pseudoalteromonas TaxID=194690 RepID=UPI0025B58A72|nr:MULTISPECIES: hypothetical protein [unclassified Pseudoalteromonas]MDN3380946.1 hypothetical protein [Pseudoalteromonas sp. APC 3893]MDN3389350.1 hypothetical protein [Pseudoalteromonas sp. APC 4017]
MANRGRIPITWKLFIKAKLLAVEALLVPSNANDGGVNLVFFEWSNETIQIHDPDFRLRAVYGNKLEVI